MPDHDPEALSPDERALASLRREVEELKQRLDESEAVISALRAGAVDAVVIGEANEVRVYNLVSTDQPYRVLVESIQEGAVTLSHDGAILYCNPSFQRIVRAQGQSLAGTSFFNFLPPKQRAAFADLMSRGEPFKAEYELHVGDEERVSVYLSCSAADLVGDSGMCAVVTDLTERKKLEEITASDRLTRSILDQAAEAIIVCDADGRIIHAGRQADALCGFSPLWLNIRDVFAIPQHGNLEGRHAELDYRRYDGNTYHLTLSSAQLLDDDERLIGYVHILADSTERRIAEDALYESERRLRDLNETLEQRVAARTDELRLVNLSLLHKNRELQEFAYVASHDLQEPLRKIATFTDLIGHDFGSSLPPEAAQYLDRIQRATLRMSTLLQDLLLFSRVATHGKPFERIALGDAVVESMLDLDMAVQQAEAVVEIDDLPYVFADPLQMRLLFQNLIGNALKFRSPGAAPHIHVQVGEGDLPAPGTLPDEAFCRIDISDNGIGFDEKYLDRIFSPFQRLHGRSNYPGTGMGLAICRRIAERHQGAITARSTPGGGSVFSVWLPVQPVENGAYTAESHDED